MKYTIEGFSQEKMLNLGLDIADALIFRWFVDFANSDRMKKINRQLEDGNKKDFFLVKYDGVLRELPILGISSTKAISKRFDKYVSLGLLEKTVVRGGLVSGTITFFAFTNKIVDLQYSSIQNQNTQDKKTSKTETPLAQTVSNTQKSIETKKNKNNVIPKGTQIPVENQNTLPKGTQIPVAKGTQLPVGIINSSTKNSSTTSSASSQQDQLVYKNKTNREEEKDFLNYEKLQHFISELFCVPFGTNLFSNDFYFNLQNILKGYSAQEIKSYLQWSYEKAKQKNPSSLVGYFYATAGDPKFFGNFLASQHFETQNTKSETTNMFVTCPACNTLHDVRCDCDTCGLKQRDLQNQSRILIHKKIFMLDSKTRNIFEKEYKELEESFFENFSLTKALSNTGRNSLNDFEQQEKELLEKFCLLQTRGEKRGENN